MNSLCSLKIKDSVAFDFDGTLVNCKTRQVELLKSILRRKDINLRDFNADKWWKYKTNGFSTYDALIKMQVRPETAKYINTCWINLIENPEWLDLDIMFDNVISLLQSLIESDINVYIITARKSEYFFQQQIRKLGIEQYIKKYYLVNPIYVIEQKSEILNQLKPSFFIGDTENDFYSAKKAGTKFIAVITGQRSKKFLTNQGIELIVDNISELGVRSNLLLN